MNAAVPLAGRPAPHLTLVKSPARARPFLFPSPGDALRGLLDHAAATGLQFSEEQAVQDVMLALDRADLKPYRYLAARWGWSEPTTYRKLPALKKRAAEWRAFYAQSSTQGVKQAEAEVKQDEARTAPNGNAGAGSEAGLKQNEADLKQYRTDLQTSEVDDDPPDTRAREGLELTEDEAADYGADLAALLADFAEPGVALEMAARRVWPNGPGAPRAPSPAFLRQRFTEAAARHGPPGAHARVLLALLVSGHNGPNLTYLRRVLASLDSPAAERAARRAERNGVHAPAAPDARGSGGPVGAPRRSGDADGPRTPRPARRAPLTSAGRSDGDLDALVRRG